MGKKRRRTQPIRKRGGVQTKVPKIREKWERSLFRERIDKGSKGEPNGERGGTLPWRNKTKDME